MAVVDINNLSRTEIKSAIIGMVLGDSHLELNGRKINPIIRTEHKESVKEYTDWKAQILNNLCETKSTLYHYKNGKGFVKEAYTVSKLVSKSHPLFKKIWLRFYYQNRRTIDKHLINSLTPLGISIWYMDDGSLKYKCKNKELKETSLKSWEVVLATHCFSKVEQEALANLLYKKYGIIFKLQKQNQYWFLALTAKSQSKFWDIVAPYVSQINCMHYKLPPTILRQYRAEPVKEGVETMYQPPVEQGEDIGRSTCINEDVELDRNDQAL